MHGGWLFDAPIHILEARVQLNGIVQAASHVGSHGRRLLSRGQPAGGPRLREGPRSRLGTSPHLRQAGSPCHRLRAHLGLPALPRSLEPDRPWQPGGRPRRDRPRSEPPRRPAPPRAHGRPPCTRPHLPWGCRRTPDQFSWPAFRQCATRFPARLTATRGLASWAAPPSTLRVTLTAIGARSLVPAPAPARAERGSASTKRRPCVPPAQRRHHLLHRLRPLRLLPVPQQLLLELAPLYRLPAAQRAEPAASSGPFWRSSRAALAFPGPCASPGCSPAAPLNSSTAIGSTSPARASCASCSHG